jgi:hypothetical protein
MVRRNAGAATARDRVAPANAGWLAIVRAMAGPLTCPYCGHAIASDDEAPAAERCPSCDGELLIAYRYQLVRARGEIAGGHLYEAIDSGFAQPMAVLFVADPGDAAANERFVSGHRLFANLRTRGVIGIHEVSRVNHRRPHVVMDWLAGSTLDRHVGKSGALDPNLVWAMASNLLIGLERAHRALPSLVHGQLHPGKIGFRRPPSEGAGAVLFGFEWARQVSEQDSSLADSFQATEAPTQDRPSALDLRALARSLVYGATGRWIEDGPMDRQRQQAAGLIPGPMGPFIDRMLAAGTREGYASTSLARDEFEVIRAGGERRRLRTPHERSGAAVADPSEAGDPFDQPEEHGEVEEIDEYEEPDEPEHEPEVPQPARPNPSASLEQLREQVRQRQAQVAAAQARQAAKQPSGGKLVTLALVGVFATCGVAAILADIDSQQPNHPTPPVVIHAPEPILEWTPPEPLPEPEPITEPIQTPTFVAQKWSAKVERAAKHGPIKAGSKCELWVTPNFGSSLNCRWAIDCKERGGWTRYYGNDTSGYGNCVVEGDTVVYFSDLQDDDSDGIVALDTRAERPWVLFGDRYADPARAVLLRIEGEAERAAVPSHANATPLLRRGADVVGEDELVEAGRLLEEMAASVELTLDLVTDEPPPSEEPLP